MKKFYTIALSAVVACGALLTSCDNAVSTNPTLKTDIDSVSYALGINLHEQGLATQLQQMGILTDTMRMSAYYRSQIEAATDAAKKADLEKEMKTKVDSVTKANERNISEFLKGLQDAIKAPEAQNAYFVGTSVGNYFSKQLPMFVDQIYGDDADKASKEVNKDIFLAGFATAMKKGKYVIDNPTAVLDEKMHAAQAKAEAQQEEVLKEQYGEQIEAGKKFLEENKSKAGVVTLASGLQYKAVKTGNGAKPTATDMVKVHYHGTLIDGTVFDSSVERKDPAVFGVNQVIKGWTEILQLMPVGSKWIVYVPYNLAYGAQDRGAIKPFSTLIFEIELLNIETPKQ